MKKNFMFFTIVVFAFCLLTTAVCEKKTPETQKDKISYIIGWDMGTNLKKQSIDADASFLIMGIKDALAGGKSQLTDAEMTDIMTAFQKERQEKQAKEKSEAGEKNKMTGKEFLEKNKMKKGVKTTLTGLQYRVVVEGKGEKPKADDTVTVNYKGTLIDGTEFDSSYKRGQPATFPVKGVIAGWTEALQMMKVGSTYELFIPSVLAYGERGAGGSIGPNSTLIFTVELLSIQKSKQ